MGECNGCPLIRVISRRLPLRVVFFFFLIKYEKKFSLRNIKKITTISLQLLSLFASLANRKLLARSWLTVSNNSKHKLLVTLHILLHLE